MYLFLFQAPKHKSAYAYYRYKKSNTRGEFDLRSLRKATKGDVKIWGAGTHPAQMILSDHGFSSLMNGHLLEVEDPKQAVWIKLNHDLVGKGGTTYVGGYKDIDLTIMRDLSKKISAIDVERRSVSQHQWMVTNLLTSLDRLISSMGEDYSHSYVSKTSGKKCEDLHISIQKDVSEQSQNYNDLTAKMMAAKDELSNYVKSCGMDPGTR